MLGYKKGFVESEVHICVCVYPLIFHVLLEWLCAHSNLNASPPTHTLLFPLLSCRDGVAMETGMLMEKH